MIADLVMNHTSDSEHSWFPGVALRVRTNPKRDWYVWSDTDDRYKDARIIFTDTEKLELDLWDPVRRQPITGTASSPISPTSTTTTPRSTTP